MLSSMNSEAGSAAALKKSVGGQGGRVGAIYRCIFDAVVDQRLPPGAKLTEEQLGALFDVSRTIVRSALQALAHDRRRARYILQPAARRIWNRARSCTKNPAGGSRKVARAARRRTGGARAGR